MNLVSLTLPDIIGLIGVGFILVTFAGLTLEKMDPTLGIALTWTLQKLFAPYTAHKAGRPVVLSLWDETQTQ